MANHVNEWETIVFCNCLLALEGITEVMLCKNLASFQLSFVLHSDAGSFCWEYLMLLLQPAFICSIICSEWNISLDWSHCVWTLKAWNWTWYQGRIMVVLELAIIGGEVDSALADFPEFQCDYLWVWKFISVKPRSDLAVYHINCICCQCLCH